jgi:hypothetical protein
MASPSGSLSVNVSTSSPLIPQASRAGAEDAVVTKVVSQSGGAEVKVELGRGVGPFVICLLAGLVGGVLL